MSTNARGLDGTIMTWSLARTTWHLFREIVVTILLWKTICVPIAIVMNKVLKELKILSKSALSPPYRNYITFARGNSKKVFIEKTISTEYHKTLIRSGTVGIKLLLHAKYCLCNSCQKNGLKLKFDLCCRWLGYFEQYCTVTNKASVAFYIR